MQKNGGHRVQNQSLLINLYNKIFCPLSGVLCPRKDLFRLGRKCFCTIPKTNFLRQLRYEIQHNVRAKRSKLFLIGGRTPLPKFFNGKSLGANAIVISHRAAVSLSPAFHSLCQVSYNLSILKPISIDKLRRALMQELFTVNGAFHDKNGKQEKSLKKMLLNFCINHLLLMHCKPILINFCGLKQTSFLSDVHSIKCREQRPSVYYILYYYDLI